MPERAVCRRRLLPAESLRSIPLDLPILEPLSAVNRMIALVSHDLRHPLTAILAKAEFLNQADISEREEDRRRSWRGIYLYGRNETGTLFRIAIPFAIPEGALIFVGSIHSRRKSRSSS